MEGTRMSGTHVLGVIPARYASTRLPGKPLLDIAGKSMIQHVYERTLRAKKLDSCIVATDDIRIYDEVVRFGGQAAMTRADHPNGSSRVAEVALQSHATHIVNVQGDEPLLDFRALDELIEGLLEDKMVGCATLCTEIKDPQSLENPNVVKVVRALNGNALYFSRSNIPFQRAAGILPVWEHLGVYAFTRDYLQRFITLPETPLCLAESLEQLKILEHNDPIRVIATQYPPQGPNVNAPEDLDAVRRIMANGEIHNGNG